MQFLRTPTAYGSPNQHVECIETHMSWVFLTEQHVYKLKKPVGLSLLDFTSVASREYFCREEVRLNACMAPGIYLGVMALQWCDGAFALVPEAQLPVRGETVDWLVLMKRLPKNRMMTHMMARHALEPRDLAPLVGLLSTFYSRASAAKMEVPDYLERFRSEQAANRDVLLNPAFQLHDASLALDRYETVLDQAAGLLTARALGHHVLEGHGDLRADHVCLQRPPVVIDCLEFNPKLRQVDPFDELAYLGLECAMAGAPWVGPYLAKGVANALGDHPHPALTHVYTAHRALLRARLAIGHLLDAQPRDGAKWTPLALRYIARTLAAANAFTSARPDDWPE